MNRSHIGSDGKTPLQRLHGQQTDPGIRREKIPHMPAKPARGGKWEPRFHPGVFVGMLNLSSEAVFVTEQGLAIKTRSANVRRIPELERWDADRILGMRAVPWSPDDSDNPFDIQVGMERPAEMVRRSSGEVLKDNKVARTYLRRDDFDHWGLSEGCPGYRYLRTGQRRQQTHSKACRRRIEALLKGDSSGSARLAVACVCHPESEPQKKIALDTDQDSPPHTSVSYGGSSASGAQPSVTTSTDQNTDTGDVTRDVRTGPTQELTRTGSIDDIGDDVVMREDDADENRAEHTSSSGSDSRRRNPTKRKPREVRGEQTNASEQHVPRRILGKTAPQEHPVAVTTHQALDGYREKTRMIANVRTTH